MLFSKERKYTGFNLAHFLHVFEGIRWEGFIASYYFYLMRYNYLSLHLNELLNQAIASFKRIRTGEEVEAIHQLRVNLKKINAIFRLLGFVIPESFKAKEAFKSLKELFDLMGMVRDLQIARQIIAHSDLEVNAYSSNLKSFINEQLVITRDLLLKWKKNPYWSWTF